MGLFTHNSTRPDNPITDKNEINLSSSRPVLRAACASALGTRSRGKRRDCLQSTPAKASGIWLQPHPWKIVLPLDKIHICSPPCNILHVHADFVPPDILTLKCPFREMIWKPCCRQHSRLVTRKLSPSTRYEQNMLSGCWTLIFCYKWMEYLSTSVFVKIWILEPKYTWHENW